MRNVELYTMGTGTIAGVPVKGAEEVLAAGAARRKPPRIEEGQPPPIGHNMPPLPIEPEQLPIMQFFAFIGVGPTKGYELIKSGKLRTRKIGRRRIGLVSDGRAFLRSLPSD